MKFYLVFIRSLHHNIYRKYLYTIEQKGHPDVNGVSKWAVIFYANRAPAVSLVAATPRFLVENAQKL